MVRLYRFMRAEHAKTSIESRQLKVTRINELNDPFEFFPADLSDPKDESRFKEWKRQRNEDTGLICFSKHWDNLLLWSHYARSHSGIALGFDVAEDLIFPIKYEKERLKISAYLKDKKYFDEKFASDIISTKSRDWEYEAEFRIFCEIRKCVSRSNNYFEDFSASLILREVLIGMDCSLSSDELVKLLANFTEPVAVAKITPSPNRFSLNKN